MKKVFFSLFIFCTGLNLSIAQSIYDLDAETYRQNVKISELRKKLERINSNPQYLPKDPIELPKDKVLQMAFRCYDKFRYDTTPNLIEGNWYFFDLPENSRLVLAKYDGLIKKKKVFTSEREEFLIDRDYYKFFEWGDVVKHFPAVNSDELSPEYLEEKRKLETDLEQEIQRLKDLNDKIAFLREQEEAKEKEILQKKVDERKRIINKYSPNFKFYHKSLNGKVLYLPRTPESYEWEHFNVQELENYLTEEEFKKTFSSKYGYSNYQKIKAGKIKLGDIKEIIPYIFGLPDDINKSVGSWGVHETWIYSRKDLYIFVENGIITSWRE